MATAANILALIMIFLGSSAGSTITKLARVIKAVSRLRLINTFFGPYLELALLSVGTLFPIGNNPVTRDNLLARNNYRYKLDLFKVTVISVEATTLAIVCIVIANVSRLYDHKIRQYVPYKKSDSLSLADSIIRMAVTSGRSICIVVFGIDLFFYSLRSIMHSRATYLSPSARLDVIFSSILSYGCLSLITLEIMNIFIEARSCMFSSLRL